MSNDDKTPDGGKALPKARARGPKRFSIIWLVPLITILVAGWLGYRAVSERGPTIRITFETADGLEAGKTKIMYKGVQTGTVTAIAISDDLSQAVIKAEMTKATKPHLTEGTQFWVVRPEVGLTGISGLGTLVSGAYIAMSPGSGTPTETFKGLSDAPLSDVKGTTFVLHADRLGSIHASAPVLHRDVTVGEVVKYDFDKDGRGVDIEIAVYPAFVDLVRKTSVFWNASGIDLNFGNIFDASIQIDSLATLVAGGVAFATPEGAGEAAPAGATFALQDRRPASIEIEGEPGLVLVLTAKAPQGLSLGDRVFYRQLPVGRVFDVRLAADTQGVEILVRIDRRYADLVHERTQFWNASGVDVNLGNLLHPNIRIESLESLVAGGIAFHNPSEPGPKAKPGQRFALAARPPENLTADGEPVPKSFPVVLTAEQVHGVNAGAPVLYRGIEIGYVDALKLNAAESGVEIALAIDPAYAGLVHRNTLFWNASGVQVSAGDLLDAKIEVQSLKTLIRGGIILANPSDPGPQAAAGASFALLAAPPADLAAKAKPAGALHIVLRAEMEGSVKQGDPLLYREVQVGQVAGIELSDQADAVLIHVDVEPRYAVLVQTNSVFWNASGLHASFGLFSGAEIDVESLSALLRGGIAFATPPTGGKAVAQGATFSLYSEPKKEWKTWAPHIRLPPEAAPDAAGEPVPDTGAPQVGGPDAGGQGGGAAAGTTQAPAAAEGAGASEPTAAAEPARVPMPDAVTLPGGGRVSASTIAEALADLGFDNIGSVQKVGNIAHVTAAWQGQAVTLRIDTENGQITAGN